MRCGGREGRERPEGGKLVDFEWGQLPAASQCGVGVGAILIETGMQGVGARSQSAFLQAHQRSMDVVRGLQIVCRMLGVSV